MCRENLFYRDGKLIWYKEEKKVHTYFRKWRGNDVDIHWNKQ